MTKVDLSEGDDCPAGCGGTLILPKTVNCSCHIHAPCSACINTELECSHECGWEYERPNQRGSYKVLAEELSEYIPYKKPSHTFAHGGRIFDYVYDSSSGSTMQFFGKYEGPVTDKDIIDYIGDGTFGHRGPSMSNGWFHYTKITD